MLVVKENSLIPHICSGLPNVFDILVFINNTWLCCHLFEPMGIQIHPIFLLLT